MMPCSQAPAGSQAGAASAPWQAAAAVPEPAAWKHDLLAVEPVATAAQRERSLVVDLFSASPVPKQPAPLQLLRPAMPPGPSGSGTQSGAGLEGLIAAACRPSHVQCKAQQRNAAVPCAGAPLFAELHQHRAGSGHTAGKQQEAAIPVRAVRMLELPSAGLHHVQADPASADCKQLEAAIPVRTVRLLKLAAAEV